MIENWVMDMHVHNYLQFCFLLIFILEKKLEWNSPIVILFQAPANETTAKAYTKQVLKYLTQILWPI